MFYQKNLGTDRLKAEGEEGKKYGGG